MRRVPYAENEMIQILYFAQFREQLGMGSEQISLPSHVHNIETLLDYLKDRGGIWTEVFGAGVVVCAAVNHTLVAEEDAVAPGDEIAFFPPVTGG